MILADKIINERKRNGWSQEEFADMLGVSRQAVSKWEGAQSTPDLQRIIQMAEIFGVTTDYLLKDDAELPDVIESSGRELSSDSATRFVSMEEANAFIDAKVATAPAIARGIVLCILSPALLILMAGLSESENSIIPAGIAIGIGFIALLLLVAVAVYIFIIYGARVKEYEYLEKENIETAYGVTGMVKERKKEFATFMTTRIAIGVIFCILSPVALVVASLIDAPDYVLCAMVSFLLMMVAAGVYMIVRVSIIGSALDMLLQEGDYSVKKKEANRETEPYASVYWSIVVAGYLAWSFISGRWDFTWIVWPIAGVLFGAVSAVVSVITRNK